MNRKLKTQLKKAFDTPAPVKRNEFLKSINYPKVSCFGFILAQIGYIRKRVWTLSCILIVAVLLGLHFFTNDNSLNIIWIVSSVLPFISLAALTEIARSTSYNMAELEMSCRYNFANIILVRLGILSCFYSVVFGVIIALFLGQTGFGIFRLGVYMLVPFLLTCSLSLFALNHLHSRDAVYICGCISCFVGITNAIFTRQYSKAFSDEHLLSWNTAFIILLLFTIREAFRLVKKTEELKWNLS